MEAATDTDEAGEVSLEPEGTAVDTQKSCVYLKNAIRYSYAGAIRDRAFNLCGLSTESF